jgi:hypothetical protein
MIVLEQNRSRGEDATAPCELPFCKPGLRTFPVFVLFGPVIDSNPGRPNGRGGARISCCHPAAYGETTGVRLCPVSCFVLLFTGNGGMNGSRRKRDP